MLDPDQTHPDRDRTSRRWEDYVTLLKPKVMPLILLTAGAGYLLGSEGRFQWFSFLSVMLGTLLSAGGANALNQCLEARRDGRMERTRRRPLPSGRITLRAAWVWSTAVAASGPLLLAVLVNPLTAALALGAELVYVLLYTPLKAKTPLCLLVGAVSGAVPPLMGWAGATGRLGLGGLVLAAIVFAWQVPHFLSFGWVYREDYARGGFRVLPVVDGSGSSTGRTAVISSLSLLALGPVVALREASGAGSAVGAAALGMALSSLAFAFWQHRTDARARRLFHGSVLYLPLLLALLLAG